MKRHEIESLAREIIDRVKIGQRVEDHLYDLKADWPAPADAALRIAAHGNAARGEAVMWLVGVDESRGVTGASAVDPANWYPQVEKHFDGFAPEMRSVHFSVEGQLVVALLFGTERAPFLVKNPKGGYPEFSVPWREGTRLRAARRDELLRILSPLQRLPGIEVVGAVLTVGTATDSNAETEVWKSVLKLFVTPRDGNRVVIPFHKCKGELSFPGTHFKHEFSKVEAQTFQPSSATIICSHTEAVIGGPGMLMLRGGLVIPESHWRSGRYAHMTFDLHVADVGMPTVVATTLPICITKRYRWEWGDTTGIPDILPIMAII